MTLSENIYELVLMCVIYGRLVAPRKVLSNRNKEERGTISRAGESALEIPPDADWGISGGERQGPSQAKGTDVVPRRAVEPQVGVCLLTGAPGFLSVSPLPTPT